jgi:sulfate adenylyltransferase subunit 1 (EFTu-like GTPase family)
MMGIRHVLLAVNKMDLVGYEQRVFDAIVDEYAPFAAACGVTSVRPIPVSALEGDNLIDQERACPGTTGRR